MRILLVWELIPEDTELFVIETESERVIEHLKGAHMTFANTGNENDHTSFVNGLLFSEHGGPDLEATPMGETVTKHGVLGEHAYTVEITQLEGPISNVDLVVISGFAL